MAIIDAKPPEGKGIKEHMLYDNSVKLVFNPDSPSYRYRVTDSRLGLKDKPVRGVTTVLGDIIDKPDLRMWPLNEANKVLFGARWDDVLKQYVYDEKNALIKPGEPYEAGQLQEFLGQGSAASSRKRDRGADVGTMGHRLLELLLWGYKTGIGSKPLETVLEEFKPSEEDSKTLTKMFSTMENWWHELIRKHSVEVLWLEKPIYSRRLQYCGTMDLTLVIDGRIIVLDFKTTNRSQRAPMGIYPDYFMQLGGYSYALREEMDYRIDDVGIVNIGKDGVLSALTAGDMGLAVDECERAFAFALRAHDWLATAKKTLYENASVVSQLNPLAS